MCKYLFINFILFIYLFIYFIYVYTYLFIYLEIKEAVVFLTIFSAE